VFRRQLKGTGRFAMPDAVLRLASLSPRRSALLTQIGVVHEIRAVAIDESRQPDELPDRYVQRLAGEKAVRGWADRAPSGLPVLAADTTVALGHELFGKPVDCDDAVRMLQRLAGRTHTVHTAVALRDARGLAFARSLTEVTFRELSIAECERYWLSGEPRDKAGGYAVQGYAAVFIARLSGSYSGVMGLPLFETAALLAAAGIAPAPGAGR
jgi:septum formation protein